MDNQDFFDKERETVSLEELRSLQLEKLRNTVAFAVEKSDIYKRKKNLSHNSAGFLSLEDFARQIPFTLKEDLIQSGTYENLCVPRENVTEVHFSSGTSNNPVPSFLTKKDIEESSRYLARTWYMQGVRKESVFTMFASYGLFSAGMINHCALQRIGAFVIPVGTASASKALAILKEFSSDACAGVASYYPYLMYASETSKISLQELGLKHVIAGGEPFSEGQRRYIENALSATLYDQYGLCEINTGIAGECSEKNGLHILADYVYPEIIDPLSGNVLEDNAEGELVLTTFHKEASPLIRYRTGDITSITHAPCPCGRTMPRISRIKKRVTDTIFYKGVKIEKLYVAKLLEDLGEYLNPYIWQMEASSISGKDAISFKIIARDNTQKTLNYVTAYLNEKLGFKAAVVVFNEDELARIGSSKLKNFIDNRHA